MLLGGESVAIGDCTDGASNTILVGEQSGNPWYNIRSTYMSSWSCGHQCDFTVADRNGVAGTTGGDVYIRTGIIVITGSPNPISPPQYAGAASHHQIPLTSFHAGGANIVRVDGSVHFLSDRTDANVCRQLAVRSDGTATGPY